MATKSANKYKVEWTGSYPNPYLGEWKVYKNGNNITQFLPTDKRTIPAFTYGEYQVWEESQYATVTQFTTDGYKMPEWIRENLYWLQLMADTDADYAALYNAFHEFDFRTSRYI